MEEVPGSEQFFPAQLVFLALGFLGPESELIKALDVKADGRTNIQTPTKVRRYRMLLRASLLTNPKEVLHECVRCLRRW